MQEFSIQRTTRKCHKADRLFQPGERYYSVVLQRGSELARQDFSKEHWVGPPEKSVGWWISQMPAKQKGKLTLAPSHVLLDALESLCELPQESDLAYLLAVLLVRRRILSEKLESAHSQFTECDPNQTHLQLTYTPERREFSIPVHMPPPERAEYLQQKLVELLYRET